MVVGSTCLDCAQNFNSKKISPYFLFRTTLYNITQQNTYNSIIVTFNATSNKITSNKLLKAISKVLYHEAKIINPDLVMVRAARQKILLNKPIAVGFCILELSKLVMYRFY